MRLERQAGSSVVKTLVRAFVLCVGLPGLCLAKAEHIQPQGPTLPPAWEIDIGEDVDWCRFTTPGILIVRTGTRLLGIRVEDGSRLWTVPAARKVAVRPIPPTRFAFATYAKGTRGDTDVGALLDLETGRERWTTEGLDLREIYCSLDLPPIQAVYLYGKGNQPKKDSVWAVNLLTGDLLWKVIEPFKGWATIPRDLERYSPAPLFDADGSMLAFFNAKGVRRYSLADGRLTWETKEKLEWDRYNPYTPVDGKLSDDQMRVKDFRESPPAPRWGYSPMLLDPAAEQFYVPFRNQVGAFRVTDGSSPWETPPKFGTRLVCQMDTVSQGLVVLTCEMPSESIDVPILGDLAAVGSYAIHLIDRDTGQTKWSWPGKDTWVSSTYFLIHQGKVIVASEDKLRELDPVTGKETQLAQLDLEGSESPTAIRAVEDTLVLFSPQNVLWFRAEDGTLLRHLYAPPPTGWSDAGGLLAIFRTIDALSTGQSRTIKDWWTQAGSAMWSDLAHDFSETREGAECLYMMLEGQAGPQLVAIDIRDGNTLARISLGDKEPRYQGNPFSARTLLYLPSEGTLRYYRF